MLLFFHRVQHNLYVNRVGNPSSRMVAPNDQLQILYWCLCQLLLYSNCLIWMKEVLVFVWRVPFILSLVAIRFCVFVVCVWRILTRFAPDRTALNDYSLLVLYSSNKKAPIVWNQNENNKTYKYYAISTTSIKHVCVMCAWFWAHHHLHHSDLNTSSSSATAAAHCEGRQLTFSHSMMSILRVCVCEASRENLHSVQHMQSVCRWLYDCRVECAPLSNRSHKIWQCLWYT